MIRLPARFYGPFRLLASGSTLFLLYTSVLMLTEPRADEAAYVYDFAVVIGFEFILNPLNLMLMIFSTTIVGRLCILLFFSGFVFSFASFMIDPQTMAFIIASVLIVHFVPFLRPRDEEMQQVVGSIAGRIMWYFLLIMVCAFSSTALPKMGLDETWMQASRYEDVKQHGGLLLDSPYVSVWIGVLYYGGIFAGQLLSLATRIARWRPGRSPNEPAVTSSER